MIEQIGMVRYNLIMNGFCLILFLGLFIITIVLLPLARRFAIRFNLLIDLPNQRSSHSRPIPRCGGIILAGIFFVSMLMFFEWNHSFVFPYLLGALMIFIVGVLDDLLNLRGYQKIIGMVISALLPIIFGLKLNYLGLINNNVFLLYLLSIIWIYGFINAFNFMDGIDGLVSGVAAIGSIFLFIFATFSGNAFVATTAVIFFAFCLIFIIFNFSPASIFLGDSGSMFLGYNFAMLGIILTNGSHNSVPIYVFLFIFAPIIYDSMVTFVRRGIQGKNVIEAHREHLYQRLVILGMSHRDVSLIYYALALFFGLMGLLFLASGQIVRIGLLIFSLAIMVSFSLLVNRLEFSVKGKK